MASHLGACSPALICRNVIAEKPMVNDSSPLKREQWLVLGAALLGWMFDGLDMHLYTLVAAPFVAELIGAADPKPRFGTSYMLPVIYAGNKDAREIVTKTLA